MDNSAFISYKIEERSFVSYIKREIHNLIKEKFNVARTGEIDIVVSELTSNLIKHAGKGELLYRLSGTVDKPVFELIAIDNGPGMKDVPSMMKDGVSSTNTLGHGLGSINRLSNYFRIYSQPDKGAVFYCKLLANINDDGINDEDKIMSVGALRVSKPGETICGDSYYVSRTATKVKIFFGDGLGHGEHANQAVERAIESFNKHLKLNESPAEILRDIHIDVKRTRGLVGSIAVLNAREKTIKICGVGNISTKIYNGIVLKTNMSYNGILGLNIPTTLNNMQLPLEKYQTLIMYSDGIKGRWELSQYSPLLKYDPIVMAAAIYKDHARKTDDMSILIVRIK